MAAMQARVVNGRPEPQRLGNASTNDLGEFRIFGLMPGQYYVQATWRRFGGPADPTSPDRTGYPETFFPGTTTITEAQRFTIRAGQTLGDLVMALSPIKTSRIEGTIVDADGKPLASVVISIGKIDGAGGPRPDRPDEFPARLDHSRRPREHHRRHRRWARREAGGEHQRRGHRADEQDGDHLWPRDQRARRHGEGLHRRRLRRRQQT